MTDKEVSDLLERYKAEKCTPEERAWVEGWYLQMEAASADPVPDYEGIQDEIWAKIDRKRKRSYYWPAAAAVVFLLSASILYFSYYSGYNEDLYTYNKVPDVPPGSSKAVLTLANGNRVNLDDTKTGAIANQSGVTVTKNKNGQIVYTVSSDNSAHSLQGDPSHRRDEVAYNTITTPNGGQYQIILPDGSLVFLNAASSLKYPIKFAGKERGVTLKGEGYFEITKDQSKPFIVITEGQQLQVLGTHFNISAYPNETIKTTLSEGSVQLQNSSSLQKQLLKPEQQAMLVGDDFQLKAVNSADEMAWKDGVFIFKQTPITDVLRQLSRWYSVQANYFNLPNATVDAELSRTLTLDDLLKGINFSTRNKGFKIHLTDERRLEISKN